MTKLKNTLSLLFLCQIHGLHLTEFGTKMAETPINHQETVKQRYPYFIRSTHSLSCMDLI